MNTDEHRFLRHKADKLERFYLALIRVYLCSSVVNYS